MADPLTIIGGVLGAADFVGKVFQAEAAKGEIIRTVGQQKSLINKQIKDERKFAQFRSDERSAQLRNSLGAVTTVFAAGGVTGGATRTAAKVGVAERGARMANIDADRLKTHIRGLEIKKQVLDRRANAAITNLTLDEIGFGLSTGVSVFDDVQAGIEKKDQTIRNPSGA